MTGEQHGESPDLPPPSPQEKETMRRHYEHYKELAENGQLTAEDEAQWELAQQRKAAGLVE